MALNWFKKLKTGLSKSASKVGGALASVTGKKVVDQLTLDDIEDQLILADLGIQVSARITKKIKDKKFVLNDKKEIASLDITETVAAEIEEILLPCELSLFDNVTSKPHVLFLAGVNGSGKTTTAGKIAEQFRLQNKSVILAASDTFRAAAVEQLKIWADLAGVDIIEQGMNADPASVAYDTLESAKAQGADIVIIDTAGRLHNKVNLMNELTKIKRVMQKVIPDAPHDVMLVLDGSTGQNALEQAKQFTLATEVSSLALTKIDGTAKGGVVIGISDTFKIPVRYIGVGEGIDDLQVFNRAEFVDSLFGK